MCGIVGIISDSNVAQDAFLSLVNLQHRGQSGAGMVTQQDEITVTRITGDGEILDAFRGHRISDIPGNVAVCQCRYPTTGKVMEENIQPIEGNFRGYPFYIVHNGNVVNFSTLVKEVGCDLPEGCSDTYVIARLISQSGGSNMGYALMDLAKRLRGSFNLIVLYRGRLYVIKDRFGFHPLQLAQSTSATVVASESCAFNTIGASVVRDIMPGELLIIEPDGKVTIEQWTSSGRLLLDIFELIYFCRPDSEVYGVSVSRARKEMGRALRRLYPIEADIIGGIPDSGIQSADGYFLECLAQGFPIEFSHNGDGIMRPHAANRRTFINSDPELKKLMIRLKYQAIREYLSGKRTIWADDSIVRGDTTRATTRILREAGAKEVHYIISSPMYRFRELYGIDTYRAGESLLAWLYGCDVKKMAQAVGADSINYLPLDEVIRAILSVAQLGSPLGKGTFHDAPFTGNYADTMGDYAKAA